MLVISRSAFLTLWVGGPEKCGASTETSPFFAIGGDNAFHGLVICVIVVWCVIVESRLIIVAISIRGCRKGRRIALRQFDEGCAAEGAGRVLCI